MTRGIQSSPQHHQVRFPSTRMQPARVLAVVVLALFTSACSSVMRLGSGASSAPPMIMRVYDTKAGRDITFAAMVTEAAKADMVFFGEQHDDPVTHAAEMAVLAALGNARNKVVLSLEMFERDVQTTLDNYLAGRIPEKDFLANSRPWDRYATDYRPMVEHARLNGWPVVASNIPRRLASAVARASLAHFDTIAAADRPFIAADNQCPHDAYYQKFAGVMGGASQHTGTPGDTAAARATLNRYYQAQCVKDEAMGESIVRAMDRSGAGTILLHVNGAFHSDNRLGTVNSAVRRKPSANVVVLTAVPVADPRTANPTEHREKADYVIFTRVVR